MKKSTQLSKNQYNLTISIIDIIEFQVSSISGVVRQLFPTLAAHNAGVSTPHSIYDIQKCIKTSYQLNHIPHIEKKIGRPVAFKASRIGGYRTSGMVPSV
jgi:hypothetical protein